MSKDMILAAPTSGADAEMRMLAVSAIEESLTNPRTHFDQVKLQELVDSIIDGGVHQPILVRPLPASRVEETSWAGLPANAAWPLPSPTRREVRPTHELVSGARRLRACRLAGVAQIPALIRPLTDDQVLEIQIVENLQRDDLSELEEAEGYERLMQQPGRTVEQVAIKIGKSKAYVYARLKLTALCHDARKALREGQIDASKALLIARIPDEKLQLEALRYVSRTNYGGDPIGYRDAAEYVQHTFMLRLDKARFKITDASLVPGRPACRECELRTGASPDLFSDVKAADTCTLPTCFRSKEEAHDSQLLKAAHDRGQRVIAGKEAKELMPSSYGKLKGYVRLDDVADSPTNEPLRKLLKAELKAHGVTPVLVANPHRDGALMEVLPVSTASELLKLSGEGASARSVERQQGISKEEEARRERERMGEKIETTWRKRAVEVCAQALTVADNAAQPVPDSILRILAGRIVRSLTSEPAKIIAQLLDVGTVDARAGLVEYVSQPHIQIAPVLRLLAMAPHLHYQEYVRPEHQKPDAIDANGAALQIDLAQLRKEVEKEIKDAAKAKAQRAADKLLKASIPLAPAAPAAGGAGGKTESGTKAKKPAAKTSPAARAVKTKATAAEASRDIAAALQAAEGADPGAADAAQSDEGHPRLRADAVASAAVAGPAALAPAPGWPFPGATKKPARGSASAPSKDDKPAEHQLGLAVGFMAGQRVEVKANATGPGAKYRGRLGKVSSKMGDRAYMVTITGRNGGLAKSLSFDESELEAVPE